MHIIRGDGVMALFWSGSEGDDEGKLDDCQSSPSIYAVNIPNSPP